MESSRRRRSRKPDSDEDDLSREPTPISTAPNDGKRIRPANDRDGNSPASSSPLPVRGLKTTSKSEKPSFVEPRHQPGAIVRVKLTNFVTYTTAEFFPGPNLNMVIGPNGTGKSTLVCAICLGLGWGPALLGRAKDPAEFVKHGCKEATIEIELQRASSGHIATKSNLVITRNIKKDNNKSTFSVNGNTTSNKAVLELVRLYNIQVDNLCQFLPQDKVVEFAQMNPIQMLESTLLAAADPAAIEHHQQLKQLREGQRELMLNNKGDRESLANLEKRQENQRVEVERLRERQVVQQKIEWLIQCRPVAQYAVIKRTLSHAKEKKNIIQNELRKLKEDAGPILNKVGSKKTYCKSATKNRDDVRTQLKRNEGESARISRELDSLRTEMEDCDSQIAAEKKSAEEARGDILRKTQSITALKNQKSHEPEPFDSVGINQDIAEKQTNIRELIRKGEEGQEQIKVLMEQGRARKAKAAEVSTKIERLETQSGQRESKLEALSKHTFQAWQWIKENQAKFQKQVFGPPIIECSLNDPDKAAVIEALLQENDFKIITAQCREDFRTLQKELNHGLKLMDVSIRECAMTDLENFKRPMPQQELERFGLDGWAVDCLEGPPTVLAMLCQERYLHQSALSSTNVTETQHEMIANSAVRSYVAGSRSCRFIRRAEYGAAGTSVQVRSVRPARYWTNQPVNLGRKAALEREIGELRGEMKEIAGQAARLRTEVEDIVRQRSEEESALGKIRKDKDAKQQAWIAYRGLDTRIQHAEEALARQNEVVAATKERCITHGKKKDGLMFQHAELVLHYCKAAHNVKEFHALLLKAEIILLEAQSDSANLEEQNKHLVATIDRKTEDLQTVETEVAKANRDGQLLKHAVMSVRTESLRLSEENNEPGLANLLQELVSKTELTEQDIDDMLEVEDARLGLTEGGNTDTIKEYEDRSKKIERLKAKLSDFTQKQADFVHGIREIRARFEQQLYPVIAKINDAFSESFARIGCAGEVALYQASSGDPADCTEEMGGVENGLDFANWAVHISVKFRENEPLSLLDSHRQSGGERAVSTIFYLMALQSLSRSPFRVVDEINQGMDPRNERMVHGRMVDIAAPEETADGSGSQYFLITPKLLSGLKYRRGMTVLCIVSGENMPSATDTAERDDNGRIIKKPGRAINFAAFAAKARALGLANSDGMRAGSGMGMESSFASVSQLQVGA